MTNEDKWMVRVLISLALVIIILSLSMRAKAQDPLPILYTDTFLPYIRTHVQVGLGPVLIVTATPRDE